MRSWMLSIVTLMLCGVLAAQAPVPGTFNNTPPQSTQQTNGSGNNGGYIVSPPMISYGDGITPTVVTNQDTVQVTAPQNTAINGPTVPAANPATVNNNPANGVAAGTQANAQGQQPAQRFDFIVAPNGNNTVVGGSMADDSVSLGEVARKMRNGRQIAKRTLTNADVAELNAKYPGANPSPDQNAANANANGTAMAAPAGANARPGSPFGAPAEQNSGGTAGAVQNGTPVYAHPENNDVSGSPSRVITGGSKPSARQGGSDADMSQPSNAAPAAQPADQGTQPSPAQDEPRQLPKSSSSLPLLGTLGALSTLAGILYFKMR